MTHDNLGNADASTDDPPINGELDINARCTRVVLLGHGTASPQAISQIKTALRDESPHVRAHALGALVRLERCDDDSLRLAIGDIHPLVRARAAELTFVSGEVLPTLLLSDDDVSVVETACFACGERSWLSSPPIAQLSAIARDHDDALCRESAAAALGAIGDPDGLEAVLQACTDRVTVRRRATLALAAFDDPRAEEQLRRALDDVDWQVRQAAEDLLEVGRVLDRPADSDAYADNGGPSEPDEIDR